MLVEGEGTPAAYAALKDRIEKVPGVLRVEGPVAADATAYFSVLPEGQAVGEETQQLVRDLRAMPADSFDTSVTGTAAVLVNSKDAIADRLPWAIGIIVVVTLLLVFLLTGSVLIPIQAVLLNALSLTAMFGAVVWVFQDGNLSGILAFTSTGDIETTLPVLMFCVAFGLSMDYGVFLLSRIKEEYDRTGDHERSVTFGLSRTGGLITAAAVILAVVMVAIGTSRVTNTKMLGARDRPRRPHGRHGDPQPAGPRRDEADGPRHLVGAQAAARLPPEVRPQRRGVGPGRLRHEG
ncbi:hypothetical protein SMICM304S_00807 [Streptomyces microflavus]